MGKFVKLATTVAVAAGLSIGAQDAQAASFSFFNITGNSPIDLSGQLTVDVDPWGTDQVAFTFWNDVDSTGEQSSIASIYFDDGTLLGLASVVDGDVGTVDYEQGASPPDLPGGNSISPQFNTTAGFLSGAEPAAPENGVSATGEWVRIIFDLIDGQSYADTIAALALGGADGGLRIGLHMIALADGESDSYINNPTPIPLPAGLVLFLSGLAGVGFLGRYKARRRELAAT